MEQRFINNRGFDWTKERPTQPGLYDVSDDDGWTAWLRVRIQASRDGRLFFVHPVGGRMTFVKGLNGYSYRLHQQLKV